MAKETRIYQKLIGWRGSIGTRVSLWLGQDHVLLTESNMMTERYQRVWLRDIQGFLIRPNSEARWSIAIGAGLLALFITLGLTLSDDAALVCWVLATLCSPVLVYGLFSARTLRFYAVTAVQRAEWPNVARRRHARKVLARLEPLIREAQRDETAAATAPDGPATNVSTNA